MNALQQYELMDVEEIQSQEKRFEISDLESLNWAFRKLAALKSQEKEIKQLANIERDRIAAWEKSELSTIENSTSFFESLIQNYHAQQLAENPKAKTISTPYGKSRTRKSSASVEKVDEGQLLDYVLENEMDNYLKTELKWGDLKKSLKIVEVAGEKAVIDEYGQLVPGVSVKPETVSYSVEV